MAEFPGPSEKAVGAIYLPRYGHMEQSFAVDYKLSVTMEPLVDMLSAWIESIDLSEMLGDVYRAVISLVE